MIRTEREKLVADLETYRANAKRYGHLARRMKWIAQDDQMATVFAREATMNLIAMQNQIEILRERAAP